MKKYVFIGSENNLNIIREIIAISDVDAWTQLGWKVNNINNWKLDYSISN